MLSLWYAVTIFESTNHSHQFPPQRPGRHQQDVRGVRHFWWAKTTHAIQKQCDGCKPCKMSVLDHETYLTRYGKSQLLALNKPNEEYQLDSIFPTTETLELEQLHEENPEQLAESRLVALELQDYLSEEIEDAHETLSRLSGTSDASDEVPTGLTTRLG